MTNLFKINGNKNIGVLIISIIIAEGIGILSSFCAGNIPAAFAELYRPSFTPPTLVFPIVWTILYFLMAVAAYRIWLLGQRGINVNKALILYSIQLILNFAWTIIFFRFKFLWIALVELIILLIFIINTAIEFRKFDRTAFILMIPYIIWVSFAIALNYVFWRIN